MAHLACTCAAWPTAPCCRAPVCRAQPLALPHCRCTRQGPRQRLKRRLLRGLHRYRLSRLRWRRRPSPRTRLGRLRSGADRTVHPRSTRQPSRRPCLASAQRHPVDPDAGSTLQLGLGAAGLNMPYARSPTSCCSPSPAVLCSHATPVPPVHATSPSRLRQPKLQRRVVEAAYGAGWAEVSATIAGATPWRQATSCPRHHPPCAPLTPPSGAARSDEGQTCNINNQDCDAGGKDNDGDCDGDCDTYRPECVAEQTKPNNPGRCRESCARLKCSACLKNCGDCNGNFDCKNECDGSCDSGATAHNSDCDAGSTCNAHTQACDDSCDSGCSCGADKYGAAKHHHHS